MEDGINNANASFSEREKQVADLLSRGYTEKEIADKLFISPATVNNHTRHIREKFGLKKNSEIIIAYIASLKKKPFNLSDIRKYGISIILVMLNICEFNKGI